MLDFHAIQQKWQKRWEDSDVYVVKDDKKKKKFYVLEMFPYPSSYGLHMGHALNYTIGDIYARYKRMNDFNVLYPMGFDAFGLPAENAAIKAGEHPKKYTIKAMENYKRQMNNLGLSYDWSKTIVTCEPEYYKWNQYFFLKFYESGLVYRKKSAVNWCSKCNTVLANEQVHNGKCWRHEDTQVELKHLEQWFIRTTKYADELLNEVDNLKWPERIKAMQKNWIGKSYGTEIKFKINREEWPIFTTRPDTIFGVTFMVISAQHPRLFDIVTKEQKKEVEAFLKKLKSVSEKDAESMEKEGVFTGSYAINPITNDKVPVYVGNFVVADYGAGMVMAVPAHDQRDFEFAKKYNIPIKVVISPEDYELNPEKMSRAFTEEGILINSGEFNGMRSSDAIEEITKFIEKKKIGKKTFNYKLRDWLISRQRYWGTPIPMIYCDKCGIVPVPEKNLPVILPEKVKFGEGNPLASSEEFVNVKCPKCNSNAKRETDTMDTFFDSSWYFLRYCDNKNNKAPFDKEKVNYWMPVDQYIGGAEHACMHLIYARFFVKALRDMGYLKFNEPFTKLFNQGMLHGSDGEKMSKSRGNVVLPEEVSKKYGIDTARFFLMFNASPDKDTQWSDNGIEGSFRFMQKLMTFLDEKKLSAKENKKITSKKHKLIRNVTNMIENFEYNKALIEIMGFFNYINRYDEIPKKDFEDFVLLLAPFIPHNAEELWEKLGHKDFICKEKWPKFDEKLIDEEAEYEDEILDTLRQDINQVMKLAKISKPKKIKIFVAQKWKYDLLRKIKELNTRNVSEILKALMQSELRSYGQEITKLVPKIIDKMPEVVLPKEREIKVLESIKDFLEKEFDCSVNILDSEKSQEEKAKNALPGKPAILVE